MSYSKEAVTRTLAGEGIAIVNGAEVKVCKGADYPEGKLDPWLMEILKRKNKLDEKGDSPGADIAALTGVDIGKLISGEEDPAQLMLVLRHLQEKVNLNADNEDSINLCEGEIEVTYEDRVFYRNTNRLWRYQRTNMDTQKAHPCYIHFHGGGWFTGSPQGRDNMLKYIAEKSDAVIFDFDYSLAPEHRFPEAFNECYEVIKYIYDHAQQFRIDPKRIAVGGGSAGANLTAGLTLRAKHEGRNELIALQILINPPLLWTDDHPDGFIWSINQFPVTEGGESFFGKQTDRATDWALRLMAQNYMGKEPLSNIYFSPMLAVDLSGLPPALVVTAELDGLRLEAEHYAGQLKKAGVPVKACRYSGTNHDSLAYFGHFPAGEACAIEIVNELTKM
ncbi:alpha/beta hydrolase [Paenibacillus amylolyticus]|uniref:alpha/beta hydrolase n=1 Tax=Paenibacillus amylolyticus TaxID=1451 RepID=UPI00201E4729|nr:alpha/beta hydrolase [Paenibacillus amylolyticus]MCL6662033.1 alpha/beta hydrolase [Paenibacillus amylolyticus]